MTRTVALAEAWGKAHATDPANGQSWDQKCAAFVYWCMGAAQAYPSANDARHASGGLNPSRNLPLGAIAWFDYGQYGHVAFHVGNGQIAMASSHASNWGAFRGTMTISQYEASAGARYLGYTMRFGNSSFAITPVKPPVVKPPVPPVTPKPPVTPPTPSLPQDTNLGALLHQGQTILPGHYLSAGNYRLRLGANSVLIELGVNSKLIWQTSHRKAAQVKDHSKSYAILQPDGNFVLYGFNAKGKRFALWSSRTNSGKYSAPGEHVVLSTNGRLVVQPANAAGKELVKAS
jgi:hypothetical protein